MKTLKQQIFDKLLKTFSYSVVCWESEETEYERAEKATKSIMRLIKKYEITIKI